RATTASIRTRKGDSTCFRRTRMRPSVPAAVPVVPADAVLVLVDPEATRDSVRAAGADSPPRPDLVLPVVRGAGEDWGRRVADVKIDTRKLNTFEEFESGLTAFKNFVERRRAYLLNYKESKAEPAPISPERRVNRPANV